jgi:hypothetical protein
MSDGQWRVFFLLLTLLGLEFLRSKPVQDFVNGLRGNVKGGLASGTVDTNYVPLTNPHQAFLWFLGFIALLALASPAPDIATLITLLLIAGVLLAHWNDVYAPFLGLGDNQS